MKIKDIPGTSTFAWSSDVLPLLATGSAAGAIDLNFSSLSHLELWDPLGQNALAIFSSRLDDKFTALAWLRPFEGRPRGVLVGAMETGEIQFWDADLMISSQSLSKSLIHTSKKHRGIAKCLLFNPHQAHVLATGGQHGEIFIWDIRTFADPFAPGRAMTAMDEISCVAWNNAVSHILATTSNGGFTSIWDLKSKREVLHLSYNGLLGRADFSWVAWHPLQLTKLATASQSDGCPLIMTWDLRNASEPEKILQGHNKGVLSLDWCLQDPELLISSGKDNATMLWNPITAVKLGEYPVATNWTFLTKLAPRAPDVFATASFDGKIVVQTLQDTSPPLSEKVKATDDNDFWSSIATTETHRAIFDVQQAPSWLKTPCGVSFGFGSKIVTFKTENNKSIISVTKVASDSLSGDFAKSLHSAVQSNDYTEIIDAKVNDQGEPDHADWEVLQKLAKNGKDKLLQGIVDDSEADSESNGISNSQDNDEREGNLDDDLNDGSFFQNLANDIKSNKKLVQETFVPSGEFKILNDDQSENDAKLAKLLLSNKIADAVDICLEQGKILEALILSLEQSASVKENVKNYYFKNHSSDVLSRLIYSASSRDVLDVVSNADISNWREIASCISSYRKDNADFSSKIIELGDRILASGADVKENRDNALTCYLAGGALDKVSSIWLKEVPALEESLLKDGGVSSPFDARWSALGSFVEKLAAYRSISQISEPLSGPSIEPVCKAVFEFSSMAATGGHFELAYQFLNILPDDFTGLKAEKERIATALGLSTSQTTARATDNRRKSLAPSNGAKNRYGSTRFTPSNSVNISAAPPLPNFQNGPTGAPALQPAAPPPVPNTRSSFSGPTNPYMPSGAAARASISARSASVALPNPYTPEPSANNLGAPVIGGPNNLAPSVPSVPVGPTGSVRPPATPSIATPLAQQSAQFGAPGHSVSNLSSPPPQKPSYKVETDGWNDLPETFKAKKPARRAAAAPATVALESPVVAHAPVSTPHTKHNVSSPVIRPPPKVVSRMPSKTNVLPAPLSRTASSTSKYAPPVDASHHDIPNGAGSVKLPPLPSNVSSAPPKNPYAPRAPPADTPKTSYAPPPANTFAPPTRVTSSPSVPHTNPYAPSVNAGIAPPVRPPSSQLMHLPVRPPSRGLGLSAPPRSQPAAQIPPPPKGRSSNVATPPVSAPPIRASRAASAAVNGTPTGPGGATLAASPAISAPSGPPRSAQAAAPHVGPPPSRPPRTMRTASISSVTLHLGPGYPTAGGDRSQIPEAAQPIYTTFTKFLEEIKPAAPAKYVKHVADMEKRLNILFDHLNKQDLLTEGAINSLKNVATLLESKKYSEAASANNEILTQHPGEVGAWHTGVKRLITMAEAFDS